MHLRQATSKPSSGVEDLATRQVKEADGSTKRALSPQKREVVEDQFYKYLTVNQYPLHIINQQMDRKTLNSYHHNSISAAIKKVKKEQVRKVLEELANQKNLMPKEYK
ncbi:hypothetical protein TSAR_007261 [Trichomalopsis sarcophagae]|uniref:Uncharacterized protein n=1 Tax=Trichomalopsis sarcophagae TaxID=543379 RepID=A0A232F706_9HYME|nr:hypothetical protein TSAR_007261 [Trichomalopsis sarcophagae]